MGVTAALQFLPMLLLGAWGGVLADRMSKRRVLMVTQTLMAMPALVLWALTASGDVTAWMVYVEVFARGAINAIDNPARQAFVMELVGRERVVNAVSLNSLIVQSARIIGQCREPSGAPRYSRHRRASSGWLLAQPATVSLS